MSLRKVSDLEGLSRDQLSASQFGQALIEVSNPVSGASSLDWSYKSQYVRAYDYAQWTISSVSGFSQPVFFYNGLALSGNLCCNADNPGNDYFAKTYFGNFIDVKTRSLSVTAQEIKMRGQDGGQLIGVSPSEIDFNVDLDMNRNRIKNVSNPTVSADAVNKSYVDNICDGIRRKLPNFGMFASCDYVVQTTPPTEDQIRRARAAGKPTFYFIVKPQS